MYDNGVNKQIVVYSYKWISYSYSDEWIKL